MYCTFESLASGFYTCGGDNEYCYNYFKSCKKGAYDDGSTRANYHDNYFFTTTVQGILA
jgi:hypothetical protein